MIRGRKSVALLGASLAAAVIIATAAIAVGVEPVGASAQTSSVASSSAVPSLNQVIAELNSAAAKFKSAQADFSWNQYQAVVQEHDIQSGTIYFDRRGADTWMAAYVKQEGGATAPKDVVFNGSELQLYQPSIKQLQVFRATGNQMESYLTLGFGGSGNSLKQNWDVTVLGRETMENVPVVKLDLKPKSQNVQNTFTHVTIWVDTARGISLKQVFYQPSGDQSTNTYSNIRYNQPISQDIFHLKIAPGTAVVHK